MKSLLTVALASAATFGVAVAAEKGAALDQAIDAAIGCRGLADDGERLSCLDKAAALLAKARGGADKLSETTTPSPLAQSDRTDNREEAPERQAEAAPTTSEKEVAGFGGEVLKSARADRDKHVLNEITASATVGMNSRHIATLYLDNGQVWRQLESDSASLPYLKAGARYPVTIRRGAFGSYMATVNNHNPPIRVRRAK